MISIRLNALHRVLLSILLCYLFSTLDLRLSAIQETEQLGLRFFDRLSAPELPSHQGITLWHSYKQRDKSYL